jgi:AraC-like DNA-binding protein
MEGGVELSFGTVRKYPLLEGGLMLFPPGIKLSVRITGESASLMILKIKNRIALCDQYVLGQVWHNTDSAKLSHSHLEANQMIKTYMELLAENVTGPLCCYRFMENKIVELFHYLRVYYTPEELARFAKPLVSPDAQFMYFIWNNYRKVNNVIQFARMANYSLSNFKIKFKHVTGMSPSQWLNEQKARGVFHDITAGDKSLKEISEEYLFSSQSHLGTFCHKYFGKSPGSLRNNSDGVQKTG